MTILETERLRIREFCDDDLDDIFRFMSDPEIMRYIRAPDTDREVVRGKMATWAEYHAQHPKLGVYAIETREGAVFAGYCVARHAGFDPSRDLELGYAIGPKFAGQGLATEAAAGLARYLFQEMQVEKLVAFIHPDNDASRRILEKCGFQQTEVKETADGTTVIFELLRH